ncbi:MAG: GxxExxY protein [Deltaproteobacteria bacterium]|nr:GxxExxY protein [Deltaproteobacteria bacterium]
MNTDWDLTEQIIGGALAVSNSLGCGFLEKVYEAALDHELTKRGIGVTQQCPLIVYYDSVVVGEYRADLVVAGAVIVEIKVAKAFDVIHEAQLLNYLRASRLKTGLLLNFGKPRLEIKRMVQ